MQGARRERSGDRVTRIVFTLNNYTDEEYSWFKDVWAGQSQWGIIGKERGAEGTPHLQGACILGTRMAFSKLKTLTGFKRAHIEAMRGSVDSQVLYCSKEDSAPLEWGTRPQPGKRSDLKAVVLRVQNGESMRSLAKDEEGGVAVVKFNKGLTILRSLTRPKRRGFPIIFWLWGPTGVGKTRLSWELGEYLCEKKGLPQDDLWLSSGGLRWFDGYDGQCVAIFDDFRNKHCTSFALFLRLLDRYPIAVEFKGGFVEFTPHCIFITCPYSPERCFQSRNEHVPEDIGQLLRRIRESGGGIFELSGSPGSLSVDDNFGDIRAKCRELMDTREETDTVSISANEGTALNAPTQRGIDGDGTDSDAEHSWGTENGYGSA